MASLLVYATLLTVAVITGRFIDGILATQVEESRQAQVPSDLVEEDQILELEARSESEIQAYFDLTEEDRALQSELRRTPESDVLAHHYRVEEDPVLQLDPNGRPESKVLAYNDRVQEDPVLQVDPKHRLESDVTARILRPNKDRVLQSKLRRKAKQVGYEPRRYRNKDMILDLCLHGRDKRPDRHENTVRIYKDNPLSQKTGGLTDSMLNTALEATKLIIFVDHNNDWNAIHVYLSHFFNDCAIWNEMLKTKVMTEHSRLKKVMESVLHEHLVEYSLRDDFLGLWALVPKNKARRLAYFESKCTMDLLAEAYEHLRSAVDLPLVFGDPKYSQHLLFMKQVYVHYLEDIWVYKQHASHRTDFQDLELNSAFANYTDKHRGLPVARAGNILSLLDVPVNKVFPKRNYHGGKRVTNFEPFHDPFNGVTDIQIPAPREKYT
ncbi:uncharacterized protein KY384_007498 [Bacidia gigantensis]|uniref:uncharacterized protein n=1 Tax=Bacidia gigantensis TaxID=2732470 RepID=UPI001D05B6BB|nr:uncharacterized protein KY384_007498 [Bacidia gigantensis]KAG8527346.1 hypothetical protein KY384_007498 [Bacidia gigantensis]